MQEAYQELVPKVISNENFDTKKYFLNFSSNFVRIVTHLDILFQTIHIDGMPFVKASLISEGVIWLNQSDNTHNQGNTFVRLAGNWYNKKKFK